MDAHDEDILNLRAAGKSFREIGSMLGISHEAVRKRLKGLEIKDRVSTKAGERKLTVPAKEKERVSILSSARKSRTSKELMATVNHVSTLKTTHSPLGGSVNPLETFSERARDSKKGVSREVSSRVDDMLGAIKGFLEGRGIELYRMGVGTEAYQVKHNGQTIRLYVCRK